MAQLIARHEGKKWGVSMDLNKQKTKGMSAQTYNENILALQFSENHQFTTHAYQQKISGGGGRRRREVVALGWLVGFCLNKSFSEILIQKY